MKSTRQVRYGLFLFLALGALIVALTLRLSPHSSVFIEGGGRVTNLDRESVQRVFRAARDYDASDASRGQPDGKPLPHSRSKHLLQATLAAGATPAAAGQMRALVGAAYVSADDLGEQAAWIERGKTGAGAESLEELANVREWIDAPVAPGAGELASDARLGPIPVPNAPVYQILAWDQSTGRYYHSIEPKRDLENADGATNGAPDAMTTANAVLLDAGLMSSVSPTGLDVRLLNDDAGQTTYIVRLERVVATETTAAENASRPLALLALMAPEIVNAYQEQDPLFLTAEPSAIAPNRLAPLLADPAVRLVVSTAAGLTARPVELPLEEGVIRPVELDLRELFPAGSMNSLSVRGRVLLGQSEQPLVGAVIERLEGTPDSAREVTGPDGEFSISAIPSDRPTAFSVTTSPASGQIPVTPERSEFLIDPARDGTQKPDGQTTPTGVEVTWRVPAYQWLVVDLKGMEAEPLARASNPPYPIYVLQRRPEPGAPWRDRASDHFLVKPATVTVAVTEPGEYRVLAALNPALILESEAALVSPENPRPRVSLNPVSLALPARRTLRVISAGSGDPVAGARVVLSGAHRGLPPMRGEAMTDSDGTLELPPANQSFELTVQKSGYKTAVREIAPDEADGLEVKLE